MKYCLFDYWVVWLGGMAGGGVGVLFYGGMEGAGVLREREGEQAKGKAQ